MSEIEETLERIKNQPGVEGLVIVNAKGEVLRQLPGMSADLAQLYGDLITQLATMARSVVRDLNPKNDLTYLRVKTQTHEVMVAPDTSHREPEYMVIVLQRWTPSSS
eukprot:PLAT13241.1.p2 GENE.PLAT13241.1~~PLAT13241.1.p2  ORF type:complete len:118 (-),score=36.99 PLAT13241.1:126-446(-)